MHITSITPISAARFRMYLNGRFLTQRTTGVQRFAREVVNAASQHKLWAENTALLGPSSGMPEAFAQLDVKKSGKFNGHLWEQLELPSAVRQEFLVNLCNTAPILRRRQLVVLHDAAVAAYPQNFKPAFRAWYQLMIRSYAKRARKLATVSKFSAGEIAKYFHISMGKIEVIPESGEHILHYPADYSLHEKFNLETDGYILAVSSHAPNKNFDAVIKAVSLLPALPYKCVIVGGGNARIFSAAKDEFTPAVQAGYATDAQLRALYERAACFVYPSIYEGFGLPPLEAMSCGCPVLVSNIPALEETCAEGAAYCNPHDPHDISRALSQLLQSARARSELREAGFARAQQYTWKHAATVLNGIMMQAG